ncbi:MAG: sigma-54 dependent transcriptional regulator [Pseudomonadota bacterium]
MSNSYHIAIIDDEFSICVSIEQSLFIEGYQVSVFNDMDSALSSMKKTLYDVAVIDIRINNESGIHLYQEMQKLALDIPVIFISGNASLQEAAESLKLGAYDFLEKPFSPQKLHVTIKNCIAYYETKNKLDLLKSKENNCILGEHPKIKKLRQEIKKIAQSTAVVLISGESGTGKELIAQSIHEQSDRASKPLVKVNCSALPEHLVESLLFGHVKGAFTGADKNKKGFFEMANHGTLFLDEIADMPLKAQSALLRALENHEIQKVGSEQIITINTRVVFASFKNLKQAVEEGKFREDLYYRISVIPIHSPALRERLSDLSILVDFLMTRICERNGIAKKNLEPECLTLFAQYAWPGNVRELNNILERMVILGGDLLTTQDIPIDIINASSAILDKNESDNLTWKAYRQKMEKEFLDNHLKKNQGNISKMARQLDIDRTYLHRKLSQYAIKKG